MRSSVKTIIGNWKMYKNIEETKCFFADFLPLIAKANVHIGLSVPFINLPIALESAKSSKLAIGVQNIFFEEEGAFTGEIAASMVSAAGADFTLIGHSERRKIFKESNQDIAKKVKAALKHNLKAVLCVGESLEEREKGLMQAVLEEQLRSGLEFASSLSHLILAYEPVWAIGTGIAASPDQAQEAHAFIRNFLKKRFNEEEANKVAILYGGSIKADNVKLIVSQNDIDGALVGGASLKTQDFAQLINNC